MDANFFPTTRPLVNLFPTYGLHTRLSNAMKRAGWPETAINAWMEKHATTGSPDDFRAAVARTCTLI
jgi:hypothetical protein